MILYAPDEFDELSRTEEEVGEFLCGFLDWCLPVLYINDYIAKLGM